MGRCRGESLPSPSLTTMASWGRMEEQRKSRESERLREECLSERMSFSPKFPPLPPSIRHGAIEIAPPRAAKSFRLAIIMRMAVVPFSATPWRHGSAISAIRLHCSPQQEHCSSPNPLREESIRASHHHSRKYDSREDERHYGKSHYGRSSDSFRHSDRQSSRGSYGYSRYDKHTDEDKYRERIYSRTGHESKGDRSREESDSRSKDYQRAGDKYSRDKYDGSNYRSKEKDRETYLEHQKHKDKDSSYDKSGSGRRHAPYDEVERERSSREWESRSHRYGSGSQRNSSKYCIKEASKSVQKELDHPLEEKRKYDDNEIGNDKDHDTRKVGEKFGDEAKESSRKKPKLFCIDKDEKCGNDDERQTTTLKLSHDSKADLGVAKPSGFDVVNDLDAAKVAAMKAAELVNKNLVGVGCLTTDQKKKLLWGGKKSSTVEESGHRWDTAMFSDRERQEKFNKLMGVKGEVNVEQKSDNQNGDDVLRAEKQKELQLDLEKQYTAGLRRRDGRTVGLGL